MQICQKHWDRLRKALDDRGIGHLGAKSGEDAMRNIVTELEGRGAENDYDPLMDCNCMISSQGLQVIGLKLLQSVEICPICEAMQQCEEWWINGPSDAALMTAKEKGLVASKESDGK